MKLIIDEMLCGEDEINELCKTDHGKMRVQELVKSTVVAFAAVNALAYIRTELDGVMARALTEDEMNGVCSVIWSCLYQRLPGELDRYVEEVAKALESPGYQEVKTHVC